MKNWVCILSLVAMSAVTWSHSDEQLTKDLEDTSFLYTDALIDFEREYFSGLGERSGDEGRSVPELIEPLPRPVERAEVKEVAEVVFNIYKQNVTYSWGVRSRKGINKINRENDRQMIVELDWAAVGAANASSPVVKFTNDTGEKIRLEVPRGVITLQHQNPQLGPGHLINMAVRSTTPSSSNDPISPGESLSVSFCKIKSERPVPGVYEGKTSFPMSIGFNKITTYEIIWKVEVK